MSQPRGKYRQTDRESKQNYCIVLYWCSNPGWVLLSVIITTMPVPLCIIIAAISAGTSVRASLIIYQWDTLDARKGPDGCRDFDVGFVVLSGSQCASVPVWCPWSCVIIVLIIPLIVSSVLLMTGAVQYVSITSPVSGAAPVNVPSP